MVSLDGHVSLGAVSDSALLWLWRYITPPMSLHWVHAVPPAQNREEAATGLFSICFPAERLLCSVSWVQ